MFKFSLTIVSVFGLVLPLAAAEPLPTAQIRAFLDAGWKPGQAALEQARKSYLMLQATAPGDRALEYAYLLILMRQKKSAEALEQAEQVLRTAPDDLAALRAKIWLQLLLKKYDAAAVDAEALAAALVKQSRDPAAREQARELCLFLGRVWGFMNGPAAKENDSRRLAELRRKLTERLGPTASAWFEEGIAAVSTRYAELTLDLRQAKTETIAAREEQKVQLKGLLAEQKTSVAAEQEQLSADLAQVQADANQKLAALDQQLDPLTKQLYRLESRNSALQSQINGIDSQIFAWSNILANAPSPYDYDQALYQIRILQGQRGLVLNALGGAQAELNAVATSENRLQSQKAAVTADYDAQANAANRRLRELRGTAGRILNEEKRLIQPTSSATAETISLAGSAQGLLTYEEFPLEQERRRLIESLSDMNTSALR